jgi:hypothetical protein
MKIPPLIGTGVAEAGTYSHLRSSLNNRCFFATSFPPEVLIDAISFAQACFAVCDGATVMVGSRCGGTD